MNDVVEYKPRLKHKKPGSEIFKDRGAPEVDTSSFGPHERMTAEEALSVTLRENPPNVLIIYQYEDGDTYVRSSELSRAEANFFLDKAKEQVLRGL